MRVASAPESAVPRSPRGSAGAGCVPAAAAEDSRNISVVAAVAAVGWVAVSGNESRSAAPGLARQEAGLCIAAASLRHGAEVGEVPVARGALAGCAVLAWVPGAKKPASSPELVDRQISGPVQAGIGR